MFGLINFNVAKFNARFRVSLEQVFQQYYLTSLNQSCQRKALEMSLFENNLWEDRDRGVLLPLTLK